MSLLNPDAFTFGVLSRARTPSVLLYGPPGTGKTLLVRALAKHTKATMITLTEADVRSRYVGDGQKMIQRVFANARKNHPCIIFIDEADSIFASRLEDNTVKSHNCDINQFLVEIDGIKTSRTRSPMVIAATNRPFALDEGILRRLGTRILIDVPELAAREKILAIHLKEEPLADDVKLEELAAATPDYTGSDLSEFVRAASWYAELDNLDRMGLRTTSPGPEVMLSKTQTPPSESPPGKNNNISRRLTSRVHFLRAKDDIRPAPISDTVAKIRDFHNKYGTTGSESRASNRRSGVITKTKPPITS
ncbi:Cell division cycle protein 48-like protein [Tolypocladium ophioglossoides CBS 100239]|uniref:Cell division cycle protein 48-like protein n=1 Tax=Tolypocladium ophioglossoides (strain CBS 100239) TaxID=1163406 RepID=A0A0L0NIX7_TOLOC|nr:Cell division cycle protein 48-like protein [Tolypocladium ophioglossoides CBS 100239]